MSKYSQDDINIFHIVQWEWDSTIQNNMSVSDNMYDYYYELAF